MSEDTVKNQPFLEIHSYELPVFSWKPEHNIKKNSLMSNFQLRIFLIFRELTSQGKSKLDLVKPVRNGLYCVITQAYYNVKMTAFMIFLVHKKIQNTVILCFRIYSL